MSAAQLTKLISPKFTEDTLYEMLKKKRDLKNIEITKINIPDGDSKKGDSYLSAIIKFSLNATGINEEGNSEEIFLPVIVKCFLKNIARRKTFRSPDFFETEIYFYEKVWPLMLQFRQSKNVKGTIEVPLLLSAYCDGENDYVALEDLSYQNFENVDKSDGLDYEHTIECLKLLAKFHGLSIALKDQNPQFEEVAKGLKETYFSEKFRKWYTLFQKRLFKTVRYAIEKELPQSYVEKFDKLTETDFYGTMCKLCEIHGPYSVVNHGDAWIPNFLIKYGKDKKTPLESMLIDFQLTRYTTLSTDFNFFVYVCAANDILTNRWDDLIEEYHKALTERIVELGSSADLITLEGLKDDIEKNGIFGIGIAIEAVPMSLLQENEVSDLDQIQGTEAVPIDQVWLIPIFKDDARTKRIASVVKHAVDKGFIQ